MEGCQTRREKKQSHQRFEEEKECRLTMLYHRFISVDDQDWSLVQEKLIHMREKYGSKQAVQLCSVCLTIFLSNSIKRHETISIGSLFLRFNPSDKTPKQIAEVFKQHGRIKKRKDGEILVGVPAFNQICIPDHRWLKGSTNGCHTDPNHPKAQENELKQADTTNLKKRPPQRQTGRKIEKKSLGYEQKNSIWRPVSKGSIPPLATSNSVYLHSSPFKQTRPSKREE